MYDHDGMHKDGSQKTMVDSELQRWLYHALAGVVRSKTARAHSGVDFFFDQKFRP
jgi:hypothetical protein